MSKASCVVINNERCFDNYQVTDGVLLNQVKEKESLTFETIFCILACDTVENLQKEKKNDVNKAVKSTQVTSSQLHIPNNKPLSSHLGGGPQEWTLQDKPDQPDSS